MQAESIMETMLPTFVSMDFISGSADENPRTVLLQWLTGYVVNRLDRIKVKLLSKEKQKYLVFWTVEIEIS